MYNAYDYGAKAQSPEEKNALITGGLPDKIFQEFLVIDGHESLTVEQIRQAQSHIKFFQIDEALKFLVHLEILEKMEGQGYRISDQEFKKWFEGNGMSMVEITKRGIKMMGPLARKICASDSLLLALVAISRIPELTIDNIKKEVEDLKSKILQDHNIDLPMKNLSSVLSRLEKLEIVKKDGRQYSLTRKGIDVLIEI